MIYPQLLLDLHRELIVDLFAGGGGASCGIEMATGRMVDVAVNHDPAAVAMHALNHPQTRHVTSDVFEADPREVTQGRPVGLLWASPDCTHHSKARGGKPLRDAARKRRALAWVVTRWAGQVRPRVIILENVEEFAEWGPLIGPPDKLRPCRKRKGRTFRQWVRSLERHGYAVEWRELRACDYGAPTIRKRLFVVARCDGRPIVWPEPTHGPETRRPYRTAAECIDWATPMLSIFATREEARAWAKVHGVGVPVRPLADATMRRIARGVMRYVVEAAEPFIVGVGGRMGQSPPRSLGEPYQTITAKGDAALVAPTLRRPTWKEWYAATKDLGGTREEYNRLYGDDPDGGDLDTAAPVIVPNNTNNAPHSPNSPLPTVTGGGRNMLAAATLVQSGYGERPGQAPRALDIEAPLGTIVGGASKHALVSAFLAKHYGGNESPGWPLNRPLSTLTTQDHHHLVAAHIQRDFGASVGHDAGEPLGTVTSGGGGKAGVVAAFLQTYYGQGVGQSPADPMRTVPTVDRFGLVTVTIHGQPYVIADIAMRMLQPRELYRAQGFPDSYVIDRGADGTRLTKTEQVRMCGNSVCPPIAAALARANVPEMMARDEVRQVRPRRKARTHAGAAA